MTVIAAPGTIALYSDIGCPWATLAVWRLRRRRAALGLDAAVTIEHRCFPLELVNSRPTPRRILDAEIAAISALERDAGWQPWSGPDSAYPVSTLPALEAVQAAKAQGLRVSEDLDAALRDAFYVESRCVTMRHEVLDVAGTVDGLDVGALTEALDDGTARHLVIEQWRAADDGPVRGSPHLFLADGYDVHNPGIEMHWEGKGAGARPVIDHDEPASYDDLLRRAADSAQRQ